MGVIQRILFWAALSALVACSSASYIPAPENAENDAQEASLGPGDVFEVRVFGQPDLTGTYKVGRDGSIQFPFLGTVQAGGKEPEALARDLAKALEDGGYLRSPQVTVFLEQSNSKRLSVLGAVTKPGTFPMVPGMTVIQAISQAGGFSPLADKDGTVLTRKVDSKLERFRIPVSDITRGAVQDIPLYAGDIIFVPERIF